ncbi:glutathione S-transferase family protein [Myxococcus sp. 1LA]
MKLYFFQQSRATRVRWMLEELGIPYELAPVDMMKGGHKQPAYLKVHPLGALPAIEDEGGPLFESAAIIMHLADMSPEKQLAPPMGSYGRGEYYQWILFAMTEMEPPIITIAQHTLFFPEAERSASAVSRASNRFKAVAAVLDERMKGRDFILGNTFSAATWCWEACSTSPRGWGNSAMTRRR